MVPPQPPSIWGHVALAEILHAFAASRPARYGSFISPVTNRLYTGRQEPQRPAGKEERKKVAMATAVLRVLVAAVVVAVVGADISADRAACADQLVGLAPCLQYVQGQARSPAPDCCGGLRQVLGKSPKCLCVLVKDKDDPNLGIKINASLALALPSACGATHANVSHCPQLLNIPPNSKDAAIFSPGGDKGTTTTAAPGKDNTTSTTTSAAQQATSGGSASTPTATAAVALLAAGYLALLLPAADPFPASSS